MASEILSRIEEARKRLQDIANEEQKRAVVAGGEPVPATREAEKDVHIQAIEEALDELEALYGP